MTAMSNAMLTDQDIVNLIRTPKVIGIKTPASAYRQEHGHKRCDMDLQATSDDMKKFVVFIRQNDKFIENFSIGLRYQTGDNDLRTITLTRYNGPHGETSRYSDDHYAKPHIHRITASDIASGSTQPQERHREITDRYMTYQQALRTVFADIGVTNYEAYFPELLQARLFNGS